MADTGRPGAGPASRVPAAAVVNPDTCPRCQQQHISAAGGRPCIGHRRRDGAPCTKNALKGQGVCGSHGGQAPQAKAAAARRVQQQEAQRLMATYGERVEVDPGEELLDLICWTAGHVRWLRARVQEVEGGQTAAVWVEDDDAQDGARLESRAQHALVWGITKNKVGGDDGGTTYEAKPNIYLALYNAETDRLARLCTDAVRIGLKEREVRLAERLGEALMRVLDGVLGELGHNPADPTVASLVGRHLRAAQ